MHLLPIQIRIDLLYKIVIRQHCYRLLSIVGSEPDVFTYRAPELGFLKKDRKYRF